MQKTYTFGEVKENAGSFGRLAGRHATRDKASLPEPDLGKCLLPKPIALVPNLSLFPRVSEMQKVCSWEPDAVVV